MVFLESRIDAEDAISPLRTLHIMQKDGNDRNIFRIFSKNRGQNIREDLDSNLNMTILCTHQHTFSVVRLLGEGS